MSAEARETPQAVTRTAAQDRAAPIVDWLLEERLRAGDMIELLEGFCHRLNDAGLPIDRCNLHMLQLHPLLRANQYRWEREAGGTVEIGREHGIERTSAYLDSPIRQVFEGRGAVRRRLADPDSPDDFPILAELRAQGYRDYTIRPLPFITGRINAFGVATKASGGFAEADLALLDAALPALGAVLESRHILNTARLLLDTYVGPKAGRSVLGGTIKRGDGSLIHAAIWFCDLRSFTALSERLPLPGMIALLNGYFDRMAGPIEARGGEILKFIGDAILAIFPCEPDPAAMARAADQALAAAEEAVAGLAALNEAPDADWREAGPLRCGVALHIGEVMYGNIGGGTRQDFTVIGPAVNLVSRLESLTAEVEGAIVASAAFAEASSRRFEPVGRFPFKGIAEAQPAYRPL